MKLIILQDKLKQALNIISRISTKNLTLPILRNILLKTSKNFLELTTTDLEIGIKYWVLSKTEKEGEITVPVNILTSFISCLPQKPVTITAHNNILSIECENYTTQIKGQSSEEFPIIPGTPEGESVSINSALLCRGLSQVVDISIPSTTRPEISGIYCVFRKDGFRLVATDSFRLGEKTIYFEKPVALENEYAVILPQKTAKELINIFSEKEGEVKIFFGSNQILFEYPMDETKHPQIHLSSRLIEGSYPNYQEIIPQHFKTQLTLDKNEFLNQIKAASLFGGKTNEIKFKFVPKKEIVEVFSQNPEFGEYRSFLPAKIKGKEGEIAFNYKFLADGLLNIKSSEILFELDLDKEEAPGVLKPVGDTSYIYVVMPIRKP